MPLSVSKSSASDQRIAATDEAQVANRQGLIVNPNAIGVGAKGSYNSGVDLKNSKGAVLTFGATGEEIQKLTNTFSTTLEDVSAQQNSALEKALNAQSTFQKQTLEQLSALSESKQTSGQSGVDRRVVLVAVAALFIVVGLPLLVRIIKAFRG
jgi:hypothetical protein